MNRYFSSFMVTALLYGGVFLAFVLTKEQKVLYSDKTKEVQTIEVSLVSLPKPKPAQEKSKPMEEPKPIKETPKEVTKPIEQMKKETPKEIKKEKVVVKKDTPKREPKKIVPQKPIKAIAKSKPKTQKTPKPVSAQKSTIAQTNKTSAKEAAQKRNLYFDALKKKIGRHKSYPAMAKRREIEGSVRVQFTLTSSGALKTITILSGSKIFHSSVKSAISAALPYSPPQGVAVGNQPIALTIEYSLE